MTYPQHPIVTAACSIFFFVLITKGDYHDVESEALVGRDLRFAESSLHFPVECVAPGLCSEGGAALEGGEDMRGHSEARIGLLAVIDSLKVTRKRRKRSKDNKQITRFSLSERRAIVSRHNELRQSVNPPAADMLTMSWNTELEDLANSHAAKCNFVHNPDRNTASFSSVGENLYAHSSSYNETRIVEVWYNEVEDYDYNSNTCSGVCGHYTQVVWATSNKIGCGIRYCNPLNNVRFGSGYFIVCDYAPAGNYRGQKPYQKAKTTTKKPTTAKPTTAKPTTAKPTTRKPTTTTSTTTTTRSPSVKDTRDSASCRQNANVALLAASVLLAYVSGVLLKCCA